MQIVKSFIHSDLMESNIVLEDISLWNEIQEMGMGTRKRITWL